MRHCFWSSLSVQAALHKIDISFGRPNPMNTGPNLNKFLLKASVFLWQTQKIPIPALRAKRAFPLASSWRNWSILEPTYSGIFLGGNASGLRGSADPNSWPFETRPGMTSRMIKSEKITTEWMNGTDLDSHRLPFRWTHWSPMSSMWKWLSVEELEARDGFSCGCDPTPQCFEANRISVQLEILVGKWPAMFRTPSDIRKRWYWYKKDRKRKRWGGIWHDLRRGSSATTL